jgi:hypothetical protein
VLVSLVLRLTVIPQIGSRAVPPRPIAPMATATVLGSRGAGGALLSSGVIVIAIAGIGLHGGSRYETLPRLADLIAFLL